MCPYGNSTLDHLQFWPTQKNDFLTLERIIRVCYLTSIQPSPRSSSLGEVSSTLFDENENIVCASLPLPLPLALSLPLLGAEDSVFSALTKAAGVDFTLLSGTLLLLLLLLLPLALLHREWNIKNATTKINVLVLYWSPWSGFWGCRRVRGRRQIRHCLGLLGIHRWYNRTHAGMVVYLWVILRVEVHVWHVQRQPLRFAGLGVGVLLVLGLLPLSIAVLRSTKRS